MDTEAEAIAAVAPQEALALLTAAMPALEPENRRILSLNLQEEHTQFALQDVIHIRTGKFAARAGP